jgi:signal transduction histidine kinase
MITDEAGGSLEHMRAVRRLAEIRQEQGRMDEALDLFRQYQDLYRARLNETTSEQLAMHEMREKYEADLRVKEIEELKARNALEVEQKERRTLQLFGAIALAMILAVLAGVLWRNMQHVKRLRAQEQALHEQRVNDLLKQQEIRSLDAMMQGQERERERIAKDLHDRLGSMLSAIKLQFGALEGRLAQMETQQQEQYQRVFTLLDDAVGEVRRISHDMVRGTLTQFGLQRALEDLRATIEVPDKLKVELSVFGLENRLENKLEIALYRMVQEMVSNALKHARADRISIQVTRSAGSVNLIVEDNGQGFEAAVATEGMGMGNLRARAAEFKGVVNVDSKPGRGTSISIDIPLN